MSFTTWVKARVIWPTLLREVKELKEEVQVQKEEIKVLKAQVAELQAATSTKDMPAL